MVTTAVTPPHLDVTRCHLINRCVVWEGQPDDSGSWEAMHLGQVCLGLVVAGALDGWQIAALLHPVSGVGVRIPVLAKLLVFSMV